TPVRRQSEHLGEYRRARDMLVRDELVYPAFMTRGEVRARIAELERRDRAWPRDPDGVPPYPGLDRAMPPSERRRRMEAGDPFAWRLDSAAARQRDSGRLVWQEFTDDSLREIVKVEARPQDWGDVVLARRDVPTSYHLSVVIDDAVQ